jgi:hypothetical protein
VDVVADEAAEERSRCSTVEAVIVVQDPDSHADAKAGNLSA